MAAATKIREDWRAIELARGRPLEWVPRAHPGFTEPRHLTPIDDYGAAATRGEQIRVAASAPVRHGKSTWAATMITRFMALRPGEAVMLAGHSQDFAEAKSREIQLVAERLGQRPRGKVSDWQIGNGSRLIAAGVGGGGLTGRGASLLLVDDGFASREQAESKAERDRVDQWLNGTALTRLTPDGSVIVLGARWHPDDLHGRLVERGWPLINCAAISDDGQALWPAGGWTLAKLNAKRIEIGEYDFAALFLGRPRPREGGALFSAPPTIYDADDLRAMLMAKTARLAIAVDPAATRATHSDYSAVVIAAFHGHGRETVMNILSARRYKLEIPELVALLAAEQRRWQCPIGVEAVGGFKAVPQMLRRISPLKVIDLRPVGDKHVRALPAASSWNAGRIRVPATGDWLSTYLQELGAFSGAGDKHDDLTDATVHAFGMRGVAGYAERRQLQIARLSLAFPYG